MTGCCPFLKGELPDKSGRYLSGAAKPLGKSGLVEKWDRSLDSCQIDCKMEPFWF